MPHKSHEQVGREIADAGQQVKVGGVYAHYKNRDNHYKVIGFGIQEATDKICVIYQGFDNKLLFVRDLDDWLSKPSSDVERFTLVK